MCIMIGWRVWTITDTCLTSYNQLCVFVCVMFVFVCMYVCVRVCVCMCVYMCMFVCCVCVCVCIFISLWGWPSKDLLKTKCSILATVEFWMFPSSPSQVAEPFLVVQTHLNTAILEQSLYNDVMHLLMSLQKECQVRHVVWLSSEGSF